MDGQELLPQPITEIKPFQHAPAQNFLSRWCNANDGMAPNFIESDKWVEGTPLVQKQTDGSVILNIPDDITLWELVPLMQTIDGDTFRDYPKAIEKLEEDHAKRARLFTNTGVYIAQRLSSIKHGQEIAQTLAQEFYAYGQRLERSAGLGTTSEDELGNITIGKIAQMQLADDEAQGIDQWIAGDQLYASRLKRAEDKAQQNHDDLPATIEQQRTRALNQVFKLADRAISHPEQETITQKLLAEKPYYALFVQKIKDRIKRGVEDPVHELMQAIYLRGLQDIKSAFIRSPDPTSRQLSEYIQRFMSGQDVSGESLENALKTLNIPGKQARLQQIKETGTIQDLSGAQMDAVRAIQDILSERMDHLASSEAPTDILNNGAINCVGAGLVADVMLRQLGIPNAPVTIPGHLITAVETADQNIYLIDVSNGSQYNRHIQEGDFEDGSIEDIHHFINNSSDSSLVVHSAPQLVPLFANIRQDQVGGNKSVTFLRPMDGIMMALMSNIANNHEVRGDYDGAIEVGRYLVTHYDAPAEIQQDLARAYMENGQLEEAAAVIQNTRIRDDVKHGPHHLRGQILEKGDDHEAALMEYKKAYEQQPLSYEVLTSLCNSLIRAGNTDEALGMMKRLAALHFFREGSGLLHVGNLTESSFGFKKAQWSFLEALREDPSFYYAYYGISRAKSHLGDTEGEQKAHEAFLEHADPEKDAEYIYLLQNPTIRDAINYEL